MTRLAVVMDPIGSINFHKDSTLAMLWEAQARGWTLYYMEQPDLYWETGTARARRRPLTVYKDPQRWFELGAPQEAPLADVDVILMRKDPPFDLEYIYTTYLLEHAEAGGALVVNRARSLRDANEKFYATWFPQCLPPTLITREHARLRAFLTGQQEIVVKPLDGMGGASVFRVGANDTNANVIFETLTQRGTRQVMAQRYLPEIRAGDKRILLIDGEPIPYALARIPAAGDNRGNLAAGGTGTGVALSARDRWICGEVGPKLREAGLLFVGLDVIGDYLTEINVTSPTCIRELDKQYGLNISATLLDAVAARRDRANTRR